VYERSEAKKNFAKDNHWTIKGRMGKSGVVCGFSFRKDFLKIRPILWLLEK